MSEIGTAKTKMPSVQKLLQKEFLQFVTVPDHRGKWLSDKSILTAASLAITDLTALSIDSLNAALARGSFVDQVSVLTGYKVWMNRRKLAVGAREGKRNVRFYYITKTRTIQRHLTHLQTAQIGRPCSTGR